MLKAPSSEATDEFFGVRVPDPYRPLEDPDAPETRAWVEAQNARTRLFLDRLPSYARIRERLTQLYNFPRAGLPVRCGSSYFQTRNSGLQNQPVLYRLASLTDEPQPILDPNQWSDDGTEALVQWFPTKDGRLLAYCRSGSGSDWQEIHVLDTETAAHQPDRLRWCKFSNVAWKSDNSGFFYNRMPEPGTVPPEDENNFERVYWHALGTEQEQDTLVFAPTESKELGATPWINDDGSYLLILENLGTDIRNGLYVRRTESDQQFTKLFPPNQARFTPIDILGSRLFVHTDLDAPRGRVIAVDLNDPAGAPWQEIIPEGIDTIESACLVGERLAIVLLHDAHNRLAQYDLEGRQLPEVPLPGIGSVSGVSGQPGDPEVFLGFSSFLSPHSPLRLDLGTAECTPLQQPHPHFESSAYETHQVFVPSTDGVKVPMFLTHRHGLPLDGNNPTLLYGYGGFNINITPEFSVLQSAWIEAGGVLAVVNLRGGNEYGEEWHRAGMLERKQQVFDDFTSCARWLSEQGYTRPARLASRGGSNGGLLVAACMLQRPELFGAVVCQVPVTDMLRYQRFTVGRYWVPEYGSAEQSAEAFRTLYSYSPLHNVVADRIYPPILITTAESDDRVVPAHGKKFAATLQEVAHSQNVALLRVESRAGHGAGKPLEKAIEEQVDVLAFLFQTLGVLDSALDVTP